MLDINSKSTWSRAINMRGGEFVWRALGESFADMKSFARRGSGAPRSGGRAAQGGVPF